MNRHRGHRYAVNRFPIHRYVAVWLGCWFAMPSVTASEGSPEILVVVGAAGGEEYGRAFRDAAMAWQDAAESAGATVEVIGIVAADSGDRDQVKFWLGERNESSKRPIWLVLIGHGTYARDVAKFNLRGPDVSAAELSMWCSTIQRPMVVINGASASAPFINRLSQPGRIIVTATQSGNEQNYVRFGQFFASAIASIESDLDHDDEVSILEAFVKASADVQKFYDSKDRIATEHALIDDNGDGLGTPASMVRRDGVNERNESGTAIDGDAAARMTWSPSGSSLVWSREQLEQRAAIEADVGALRKLKPNLDEDDYFDQLERLMVDLARLYGTVESQAADLNGRSTGLKTITGPDASDKESK